MHSNWSSVSRSRPERLMLRAALSQEQSNRGAEKRNAEELEGLEELAAAPNPVRRNLPRKRRK
jgi:hypothetical protein